MPVVSNTSPILNLAIIGRLDLLQRQFGEVLIPTTVLLELKLETELPGVDAIRPLAFNCATVRRVVVSAEGTLVMLCMRTVSSSPTCGSPCATRMR